MSKSKYLSITIMIFIMMLTQISTILAQSIDENLADKYWHYRETLLNDFMLGIGPDYGFSLPGDSRSNYKPGTINWNGNNSISWSDGTIALGHYIGILATEYHILLNNNNNIPNSSTNKTIEELFWALSALNRLDYTSETYYSGSSSLNGHFIRDDVNTIPTYDYLNTNSDTRTMKVDTFDAPTGNRSEVSKDQVIYLLMGLELARKYIPSQTYYYGPNSVNPAPFAYESVTTTDILQEVINIEKRLLTYISSNKGKRALTDVLAFNNVVDLGKLDDPDEVYGWWIINPVTNQPVLHGRNAFSQSWGFSAINNKITGSSLLSHDLVYSNFLFEIRENNLSYQMAKIMVEDVHIYGLLNNTLKNELMESGYGSLFLALGVVSGIYNNYNNANPPTQQYDMQSFCFNQGYWDDYKANFDWIVMLQGCLYPNYVANSIQHRESYFTNLLNKAPLNGPTSYNMHYVSTPEYDPPIYDYEWSTGKRTTRPEYRGDMDFERKSAERFSGIDYLLMYNLYCINYNKSNFYGENRISLRTDNIMRNGNTHYNVAHTIHNAFNKSYTENCIVDIPFYINSPKTIPINNAYGHSLINNNSSLDFNFNKPIVGASPSLFEISNNGKFIVGDFTKSTTTTMSGVVNINEDAILRINQNTDMELYENSVININSRGTLIIKSLANLKLYENSIININDGGSLIIESTANLKLFDDSKININYGGQCCISNSANITLTNASNIIEFHFGSKCVINPIFLSIIGTHSCTHPGDLNYTGLGSIEYICADISYYDINNILEITYHSEVWDNVAWSVKHDIIIKDGAKLTIKNNSHISFGQLGSIIIEKGGKLILDNSVLDKSDRCDNLWKGILVKGNYRSRQTPEINQGVLEIKNKATISNAEIAVSVGEYFIPNSVLPYGNNPGGGIIKIDNANFVNNQKDIVMQPYGLYSLVTQKPFPQRSSIKNSSFRNDANMLENILTHEKKLGAIYLSGISKINILGNRFENSDNSLAAISKGIGINIINSSANITDYCKSNINPCDDAEPNKFINLYQGVRVINGLDANNLVKISKNEFSNTYRAIFLSGTNGAVVLENDIEASKQAAVESGKPDPGHPYGIYINGGKGFRVEENKIYRPSSNGLAMFNGVRGIIVENTGAENNQIYKNTLTNLYISNQAQMYNSGQATSADLGLKYFCNTSQTSESSYDFQTFGDWYKIYSDLYNYSLHQSGIAGNQKQPNLGNATDPYLPAGNQFSSDHLTNGDTDYDFDNGGAQEITYSWADLGSGKWKPTEEDNVLSYQMSALEYDNVCPSKIKTGGNGNNPTDLYTKLEIAHIAYNSSRVLLSIWEDGGNANLKEEVKTIQPWDVYLELNQLLSKSPYLSEEVIIEVIFNQAFTPLMVKLLMIANPHARESFEIMQALEKRIPVMPKNYINEIESQPKVSSQLKVLEGNVAADYHLISNIGEDIKRIYKADMENSWAKDSLINFVSRQPNIYDKFELANIYLSYGDFDNVRNVIELISNNYEMNEGLAEELETFSNVLSIANTMKEKGEYENSLSERDINGLQTIVDNNSPIVSPIALSLLCTNNPNYQYEEVIFDVSKSSARIANPQVYFDDKGVKSQDYKLYPNPTNNYTTLSYSCKYNNISYSIVDNQARLLLVKQLPTIKDIEQNEILIDLSKLSSGTYQILIKSDNVLLWSESLVVSK